MGFLFCPTQGFAGMSSKIPKSSNSPSLAVFPHGLGCSRWGESETVKITLEKLPEGPCPLLLGELQHLLSVWVPVPKERPLGNWEVQQVPAQCMGNEAAESRIPMELQRPKSIFPFSGGIYPSSLPLCLFIFGKHH